MGQLYTIGHSNFPEEHLFELLKSFNIDYVLDVRSTPYSRYTPQYNSDVLKERLKDQGIVYAPMGKYFGARQPDVKYYPDNYLDFELFRESDLFKKGRDSVLKGLDDYNIALMCTEKNPADCHRTIMVARGFELIGVDVKHILHDNTFVPQSRVNKQLLDMYFPDRGQLSIFDEENKSEEEYIIESYRKRNKEIGYRIGSDSEGDGHRDTDQ